METKTESQVKVFGQPTVPETPSSTVETKKVEPTTPIVETPKQEVKQETVIPKVEDKKVEAPKVEDKTQKVETANTDKKDKTPEFKVSFENEVQKTTEPTTKQETVSVTDEVVSKFLKDTYNIEVEKLSDLSKKEELPESVAQFKKFVEETGRTSLNDFYNAQKDWGKESKDDTIKEFYKYQYPEMSEEDIDTRLETIAVSKDDEDELGDRELKKLKSDYNTEYSKALSFMNKKSKEFKAPMDSKTVQPKQQTPEEKAETYKPYWESRDKSLNNLKEINLNIEGMGGIKLEVTDEHRNLISKHTETEEAFFSRWQDKKGVIDTDKSSLDTGWSIPEVRQVWIASMLEQAHGLTLEQFSKDNRNVKLDKIAQVTENESGASIQVVGDSPRQSNTMGKPLF
jgi:hypothetical protein